MRKNYKAPLFGVLCGAFLFAMTASSSAGSVERRRSARRWRIDVACPASQHGPPPGTKMHEMDSALESVARVRPSPVCAVALSPQ